MKIIKKQTCVFFGEKLKLNEERANEKGRFQKQILYIEKK